MFTDRKIITSPSSSYKDSSVNSSKRVLPEWLRRRVSFGLSIVEYFVLGALSSLALTKTYELATKELPDYIPIGFIMSINSDAIPYFVGIICSFIYILYFLITSKKCL